MNGTGTTGLFKCRPAIFLAVAISSILYPLSYIPVFAFTGPSSTPGTGSGAIGVDAANNIVVGSSTTKAETKFLVVASSTDTSNFALKVIQPGQGPILFVRNDGSIAVATSGLSYAFNVSGTIYASGNVICGGTCGGGSVAASAVTAGLFNGGPTANYAFPNSVAISTSSNANIPQPLSVYGTSTFFSNVGIGTTNPGYLLDIQGAAPSFQLKRTSQSSNQVGFLLNGGTSGVVWELYQPSGSNDFRFYNNGAGTDVMTIQSGGNVGIGTTQPSSTFHVVGNTILAGQATTTNLSITGLAGTGCLSVTATGLIATTTCSGSGSVPASNVTAGLFNGGPTANYAFPNSVAISTSSNANIPQALSVYGNGFFAGDFLVIGTSSLYIGQNSGGAGTNNVGVGQNTLTALTLGTNNTAVGTNALKADTIGGYNTAIGFGALQTQDFGNGNTAVGGAALQSTKGNLAQYNTAVGENALILNTSGANNTALGMGAMDGDTGMNNTAVGYTAAQMLASGNNNVAVGAAALYNASTGSNNVAIGYNAGFGTSSAPGISRDVFIGYGAGYNETTSDKLWIENSTSNTPLIYGDFAANKVGINTAPASVSTTLTVTGNIYVSGNLTCGGSCGGSGITSLNGITTPSQTFATSTSLASGFDIRSSVGGVHTFYFSGHELQLSQISTTTGNLIVGNSANGWSALVVGADGKVLTASSTAANGVSWEPAQAASIAASAVTAGLFNGGPTANYAFPNSLGVNTSTNSNLPANLSVYGTGWFSGLLDLSATTVKLPLNVNLTAAGNVAVMTTSSTLEFSDGTNVNVLDPVRPIQWIIENPTASEDDAIFIMNVTSTITKLLAVNKSTGDTATFNVVWDASRATAPASSRHLFASNQAETSITTADSYTSFASSTVNAGSVIRFITSAASSSQFTMTLYYKENP